MNISLIVLGGDDVGTELPIRTPTFVIGRGERCHFRPNCSFVSLVHCQISIDKNSVVVDDASSAAGTFVNGEKIKSRHTLRHGDRLKIGTLEYEVRLVAKEEVKKKQPIQTQAAVSLKQDTKNGTPRIDSAAEGEEAIVRWVNEADTRGKVPYSPHDKKGSPQGQETVPQLDAVQVKSARRTSRWKQFDRVELLMLATVPLLTIALLSSLFPAQEARHSGIVKGIAKTYDAFWMWCHNEWSRPMWPWWAYMAMVVLCVVPILLAIGAWSLIQKRLGRRG